MEEGFRKKVENGVFGEERALYGLNNAEVSGCSFDGPEDGESALKECHDINVKSCFFNLRYPLWHAEKFVLNDCTFTDKSRAALWYDSFGTISDSNLLGIKALRECKDIIINDSKVVSPEFGWKTENISVNNSEIEAEYLFLNSSNLDIKSLKLKGKYSFQYTENVVITDSELDTKDCFWHAKNVTVKNSTIKGEYLAWFSDGLTLENCTIIGTQPLCYCTNLKLINCQMIDCDLSFEYSDVDATIIGSIDSVKNPRKGRIKADRIEKVILTQDSKYLPICEIITAE